MAAYPCVMVDDGRGGEIAFPPFITQQNMEMLAALFAGQEEDLFVVTYPRSGTTWTEQIVHLLANEGEQGDRLLTDAVPWLETLPRRQPGMSAFLEGLEGERRFTSHLPLPLMKRITGMKGRYIYVARNPKDVAVSYYYHDRSKSGYEGSWEEHFELFLAGGLMFGSYFEHVLPWWEASRDADNILFLKYEDMKRDLAEAVEEIAGFIGVEADGALVEQVVQGSSFEAMATGKRTNFAWVPQRTGEAGHYRKGVVGDWRNQFSETQEAALDALYEEETAGTGLTFDFG